MPLSRTEFRLLHYLTRHAGQVLSREQLIEGVWGGAYRGSEREVDVYVRYLRQKIESDPHSPQHILTVWGVGYKFEM